MLSPLVDIWFLGRVPWKLMIPVRNNTCDLYLHVYSSLELDPHPLVFLRVRYKNVVPGTSAHPRSVAHLMSSDRALTTVCAAMALPLDGLCLRPVLPALAHAHCGVICSDQLPKSG